MFPVYHLYPWVRDERKKVERTNTSCQDVSLAPIVRNARPVSLQKQGFLKTAELRDQTSGHNLLQ